MKIQGMVVWVVTWEDITVSEDLGVSIFTLKTKTWY